MHWDPGNVLGTEDMEQISRHVVWPQGACGRRKKIVIILKCLCACVCVSREICLLDKVVNT